MFAQGCRITSLTVPGSLRYIHCAGDLFQSLYSIEGELVSGDLREIFYNESKTILYELFSNASNHSRSEQVTFSFGFADDHFAIEVVTRGNGFMLKEIHTENNSERVPLKYAVPFPEELAGKRITVYRDSEYEVVCHVKSSTLLDFELLPFDNPNVNSTDVPEHYGLLLLTRLAREVFYQRNPDGSDSFWIRKYYTKG